MFICSQNYEHESSSSWFSVFPAKKEHCLAVVKEPLSVHVTVKEIAILVPLSPRFHIKGKDWNTTLWDNSCRGLNDTIYADPHGFQISGAHKKLTSFL